MTDWLSYSPGDFLMFGPDVYWRLFALQNLSLWPLPVFAAGTGVTMLGALATPGRWKLRVIWLALALAWLGSAHFIAARYVPINWPMKYAVWGFGVESALIVAAVLTGALLARDSRSGISRTLGIGLIAYAVLLHPLIGLGFRRAFDQAEIIGLAPDPTALASLGLLLLIRRSPLRAALSIVPVAWCVTSATTLLLLGEAQGWLLLAALGIWTIGYAADWRRSGVNRL
ncbi:hypothetical protein H0I76_04735 [Limibaculum sp. M0105]|uniref:MFS transporter permease n=1 Tax=Thermohalobaculum xanthum TaxID=2753746 RepID=A0A8J7M5C4_9RHOB|nr:DUF6064 family protein [Thermohalobaculum xanthum]MBK0398485.1 hypothetical protein [Thermohalobaculum xanthum]